MATRPAVPGTGGRQHLVHLRTLTGLAWTKADRDELLAFACSRLPRLRERTVDGSNLGTDALYEIPLMRPNGGTRNGETDAPD
jgi:hypothetical protein